MVDTPLTVERRPRYDSLWHLHFLTVGNSMAISRKERPAPAPVFYFCNHETQGWEYDGKEFPLHRIVKSKVKVPPGTSTLVSVTPVSATRPPSPINGVTSRRETLRRGAKWPKERKYIVEAHHGFVRLGGRAHSSFRQELMRQTLPVTIPANLEYGLFEYCMIWLGPLDGGGYGRISGEKAHRLSYEYANRMSLNWHQPVLHLCHRPYCIQPGHLYTGTPAQNALDRDVRLKGKLQPDWPLSSDQSTRVFVGDLWETVQREGLPLLDYVGQMNQISLNASTTAWTKTDGFQIPLPRPQGFMPDECPGHSFRIPALGDLLCSICGAFQSDAR